MLHLTVSFTCLFIFLIYTSEFTASMTARPSPGRIFSFRDILDRDMKVILFKGTVYENIFANSESDSAIRKVYEVRRELSNDDENQRHHSVSLHSARARHVFRLHLARRGPHAERRATGERRLLRLLPHPSALLAVQRSPALRGVR